MNSSVPVKKVLAQKQWLNLRKTIKEFLGLKIISLKPDKSLPDMVFTTDQIISLNGKLIKANFAFSQRRKESVIAAQFLRRKGCQVVDLPKKAFCEGGDFILFQNLILAGYGFRTKKESHQLVEKIAGKKVVSLKLVNPYLYHLDTALFATEEGIVFCPEAFSEKSRKKIRLLGYTKEISLKEAFCFGLNNLIFDKKIIANKSSNGCLDWLKGIGYQVVKLDTSEFQKAGGAIHCLTKIISR